MQRRVFRTRSLIAMVLVGSASVAFAGASSPTAPDAPPKVIAALMPGSATGVTGNWSASGSLGMGEGHANVRGGAVCDGTPGTGTINLEVVQARPAAVPIYEPAWRQKGVDAKAAVVHDAEVHQQAPLKVSVSAVKEEAVAGGLLVFFEYTEGCVQSPRPNHTTASLKGVVQTKAGVFGSFDIVMPGTAAQARALAGEILANFQVALK
jgi:hypothetical protein